MDPSNTAVTLAIFKKLKAWVTGELTNIKTTPGPKGDAGSRGAQGNAGRDGVNGVNGIPGNDGPRGVPGDIGPAGDVGVAGNDGPRGVPGDIGPAGDVGVAGNDGPRGVPGDIGPAGDAGVTGPKGKSGNNGDSGPKGDAGVTGPKGKSGNNGDSGPKGDAGKVGTRGSKGDKGDTGLQGLQGLRGLQGDRGADGSRGIQGLAGEAAEVPDIEPHLERIEGNFNKYRDSISRQLSSLGGGGSYKVLDNSDVEMVQLSQVTQNAIMIFNTTTKKFVVQDLEVILLQLGYSPGGGGVGGEVIQYSKLIDFDGTFTYIAEALPGTSTSSATWRIKRVYEDPTTKDITILWADGTNNFAKVWDNRLGYTYS
jgi:hypothetical protein